MVIDRLSVVLPTNTTPVTEAQTAVGYPLTGSPIPSLDRRFGHFHSY
jgi:hypothetical protein